VDALRAQAKTVVFLGVDNNAAAIAGDPIKETTPHAIAALKRGASAS
jgi:cation transport ATPase